MKSIYLILYILVSSSAFSQLYLGAGYTNLNFWKTNFSTFHGLQLKLDNTKERLLIARQINIYFPEQYEQSIIGELKSTSSPLPTKDTIGIINRMNFIFSA